MRTFILFARKAKTSPDFNLSDLAGSAGRMDLVCRCITASLWLSHGIRNDSEIIVILNGPPNPPVSIRFSGEKLSMLSVDEHSTASWIKKALERDFDKEWLEMESGIKVSRKSFQEVIKELKDRPIYVLHEKGKDIENVKIKENPVFVIGDHIGIPSKDEKFALRYGEKVSLGKNVYLASSCISVLNWILDNFNPIKSQS